MSWRAKCTPASVQDVIRWFQASGPEQDTHGHFQGHGHPWIRVKPGLREHRDDRGADGLHEEAGEVRARHQVQQPSSLPEQAERATEGQRGLPVPDPEAAAADRPGHDGQLAAGGRQVQQGDGHRRVVERHDEGGERRRRRLRRQEEGRLGAPAADGERQRGRQGLGRRAGGQCRHVDHNALQLCLLF